MSIMLISLLTLCGLGHKTGCQKKKIQGQFTALMMSLCASAVIATFILAAGLVKDSFFTGAQRSSLQENTISSRTIHTIPIDLDSFVLVCLQGTMTVASCARLCFDMLGNLCIVWGGQECTLPCVSTSKAMGVSWNSCWFVFRGGGCIWRECFHGSLVLNLYDPEAFRGRSSH